MCINHINNIIFRGVVKLKILPMYRGQIKSHLYLTYIYRIFIRKLVIMNTKLTLNVDKAVIEQAKSYAKSQNISLSRLIESYLASLISKERDPIEITPLVKSLSGIIQKRINPRVGR